MRIHTDKVGSIPELIRPGQDLPRNAPVVSSASALLEWEAELRERWFGTDERPPRTREVWFRGMSEDWALLPSLYRSGINEWAARSDDGAFGTMPDDGESIFEQRRLNLEREMILSFQRDGRALLSYESDQELYFTARHHGVPSRLLDWSVNPLIALFMAVWRESDSQSKPTESIVYAIDPSAITPSSNASFILDQYHPDVRDAIQIVTRWRKPGAVGEDGRRPPTRILAVRPHVIAGRIERQASRFTLHCHNAGPASVHCVNGEQPSPNRIVCQRIKADEGTRRAVLHQLERLGINQFTVYHTLDRLGTSIRNRFIPQLK